MHFPDIKSLTARTFDTRRSCHSSRMRSHPFLIHGFHFLRSLSCDSLPLLQRQDLFIQFLLVRFHYQFKNLGYKIKAVLRAPRGAHFCTHVLLFLRCPHLHQSCRCIQATTCCIQLNIRQSSTAPRSGPMNITFETILATFVHELGGPGSTPPPDG